MLSILITLSAFPGFLGFGPNPSLLDVTNRFGNPITLGQSDDKRIQSFTYARESYLLKAISDKNSQVLTLQAYGLNKSVKYRGVGLMSDFKSVIKKLGNPQKYFFDDKGFDMRYPDCVFTLVKLGRKSYHQVVCIEVNMKPGTHII